MGTMIYGAAGAAVGFAAGSLAIPGFGQAIGARWGWALGTLVGGIIDQPVIQNGMLSDRQISASAYGASIPKIWGRQRVPGNIIWCQLDSAGDMLLGPNQVPAGGGKGGGGGGGAVDDHYLCTIQVAFAVGTLYLRDPANPYGGTLQDMGLELVRLYANDVIVWEAGNTSTILQTGANFTWHSGTETGNQDSLIATQEGSSVTSNPGIANCVIQNMDLWQFGNQVPSFVAVIDSMDCTLADVCTHICGEVGIQASQLDVTAGAAVTIKNAADQVYNGLVVSDPGAPRDVLDGILGPLLYDLPEVSGQLVLTARGGSSVVTVAAGDLGATTGTSRVPRVPRDQPMTIDLPGAVQVTFQDTDSDCLQNMAKDQRQGFQVYNVQTISLPLACNFATAKAIAQQNNDVAWIEGETYQIQLPPSYIWLAPADPIEIPLEDGTLVRTRIKSFDMAPMGEIKLSLCRDSGLAPAMASPIVSLSIAGGGSRVLAQTSVVPATWIAWSGPAIRSQDEGGAVFYVASAQGSSATLQYSTDGGTSWIIGSSSTQNSILGNATTTLGSTGAVSGSVDSSNTVEVNALFGALVNATSAQIAQGSNIAVLGNEIIGFEVATLDAAPSPPPEPQGLFYTLSDIVRGINGSAMTGHTSSDPFFVFDSSIIVVNLPSSMAGQTVQVAMVAPGQTISEVTPQTITIAAVTPSAVQTLAATVGTVVVPTFLASPVTILSSGTAAAWATRSLSSDLPAGALFAIVDGWVRGTSTGDAELNARASSAYGSFLRLAKVSLPSGGGPVSQAFHAIIPLSGALSIDTEILIGFDALELRLIGYWAPT